jgi:hypothetical protein
VAGQLGYCGLDARRQPLTGEEIRGCWEARPAALVQDPVPLTIGPARPADDARPVLAFVEVDAMAANDGSGLPEPDATIAPGPPATTEPGWSLWGELET